MSNTISRMGVGSLSVNELKAVGVAGATGVTVLMKDSLGKALIATGTTLPADAGTTYAKGCLFIKTDVASGTSGLYVNNGTSASCIFKLITSAA